MGAVAQPRIIEIPEFFTADSASSSLLSNYDFVIDDTDRYALAHGYIAITPTQLDVTDYKLKDALKSIFL